MFFLKLLSLCTKYSVKGGSFLKLRKFFFVLSIVVLLLGSSYSAEAHHNGSFTGGTNGPGVTKFVAVYNPNGGGLLASIALNVTSSVAYKNASLPGHETIYIHGATRTHVNIFRACQGTLSVTSPAKFGGSNISMVSGGYYYTDPSYGHDFKHSNNFGAGPRPYSARVTVTAAYYPSPSSCIGGGTASDDWTFSR